MFIELTSMKDNTQILLKIDNIVSVKDNEYGEGSLVDYEAYGCKCCHPVQEKVTTIVDLIRDQENRSRPVGQLYGQVAPSKATMVDTTLPSPNKDTCPPSSNY